MLPIILASTSPRRIELLSHAGYQVITRSPGVDEIEIKGESPSKMVVRLALEKASAVQQTIEKDEYKKVLIIAADTTVVAPNGKKVLGKPKNEKEAQKMLSTLAGATHTVLTGYCILQSEKGKVTKRLTKVVTSRVTMRKLSKNLIQGYVTTGEPMDKAGAYGAQGIGMTLIEKIQGSYTNVVGLPMAQLIQDLEKIFKAYPSWVD